MELIGPIQTKFFFFFFEKEKVFLRTERSYKRLPRTQYEASP